MNNPTQPVTFLLDPEDNQRLADLCGEHNAHLKQVEEGFGVRISHRGHLFCVDGQDQDVRNAQDVLCALYAGSGNGASLSPDQIQVAISQIPRQGLNDQDGPDDVVIRVRKAMIRGKSPNQKRYLGNILRHDINFGIGPAGTGKPTWQLLVRYRRLPRKRSIESYWFVRRLKQGSAWDFCRVTLGRKSTPSFGRCMTRFTRCWALSGWAA